MKHSGGKAGLLETIFFGWVVKVTAYLAECFESATDYNARLSFVPSVVSQALDKDLELKTLVLLRWYLHLSGTWSASMEISVWFGLRWAPVLAEERVLVDKPQFVGGVVSGQAQLRPDVIV
jgi:hypothetical protein